ncbi:MAG: response regulator [Verrucomicrobiae bacterium]|nr:response regulator [Verrucomicrobiae bacterium]
MIVEDDGGQRALIAQTLASQGPNWSLEFAGTGGEALERLQTELFDAVLLAHQLPDMSGMNVLREIVSLNLDAAVVFNVPFGNEQLAAEVLEAGATDYVQKSDVMYPHLAAVLSSSAQIQHIKREMRQTHHEVVRAERQSALNQLSLSLRHEINNPLAALCGYAELLLKEVKDKPEVRRRVQQIYDEAMRIRDVVRRTEHVKDQTQEYLPGMKMIRLNKPEDENKSEK